MGAVVRARDDGHLRATRLRQNDQPVWVRAHALVPDRLVRAPPKHLGLLSGRVAKRAANHERAVPGESLHEDSGELADQRTTRQLANEGHGATVGVTGELLGDVLTIVAGHDPRDWIGIAGLVDHATVGKRDHRHAPDVSAGPTDHDGTTGEVATSRERHGLRRLACRIL